MSERSRVTLRFKSGWSIEVPDRTDQNVVDIVQLWKAALDGDEPYFDYRGTTRWCVIDLRDVAVVEMEPQ